MSKISKETVEILENMSVDDIEVLKCILKDSLNTVDDNSFKCEDDNVLSFYNSLL